MQLTCIVKKYVGQTGLFEVEQTLKQVTVQESISVRDVSNVQQLSSISHDDIFLQHFDRRFLIDRFLGKHQFARLLLETIAAGHGIDSIHDLIDLVVGNPFELGLGFSEEEQAEGNRQTKTHEQAHDQESRTITYQSKMKT